jgi:hypothetical protein
MIAYKIEPKSQAEANDEIKAMDGVLSEIATTLKILQNLLKQHETSISVPSLDSYRQDLQNMIPEAIRLTHLIATNSRKLYSVSDQVTKQLANFDGQVRTALVTKAVQTQTVQTPHTRQAQGTTYDEQNDRPNFRIFQRQ